MKIKDEDFEIDWFSGTGKGGQHRNKHQNCCRIVHTPTGIKATGQRSRSREDNKRDAMSVCKARIIEAFAVQTERFRATNDKVRTYHEPDNRVTDHASGKILTYKQAVQNLDIGPLIDARRMAVAEGAA